MKRQPALDFNIGLSEQEKRDLEQLIGEFQTERSCNAPANNIAEIQNQIDAINKRLAFLTNMFLTLDRRIKPLYETIRLNYQKSEILNQRISILIESMRTGESI
jgi:uncharacterized coiled-coil DUF342 family protein